MKTVRLKVTLADLAPPDPDAFEKVLDSRKQPLADFEGKVQAFTYTYDFGDDWVHQVEIEGWAEAAAGVTTPRCLAGARACPPEDCGGPPGYEDLCAALTDPKHERHLELKEWLNEVYVGDRKGWEPEVFDLGMTNAKQEKAVQTVLEQAEVLSEEWAEKLGMR